VAREWPAPRCPSCGRPRCPTTTPARSRWCAHAINWHARAGHAGRRRCAASMPPRLSSRPTCAAWPRTLLEASGADYAFTATSYPFPIQRAIRVDAQGRVAMFQPEHSSDPLAGPRRSLPRCRPVLLGPHRRLARRADPVRPAVGAGAAAGATGCRTSTPRRLDPRRMALSRRSRALHERAAMTGLAQATVVFRADASHAWAPAMSRCLTLAQALRRAARAAASSCARTPGTCSSGCGPSASRPWPGRFARGLVRADPAGPWRLARREQRRRRQPDARRARRRRAD
jgi:hypothetical protein